MAIADKLLNGEKLTRETFTEGPVDMGILPFWFWNGQMEEAEMSWQLEQYKSKGIPGLFIHGRFGEKLGYLSDKWFEKVEYAVKKARELGLQMWIYDEMNWPSGTAERTVIKHYPHLSQKYLELVALNIDGPLFTFLEATDSRYVNTGDSKPIAAFAVTEEEFKSGVKSLIDLRPNLSFNKVIPWEAPEGKWRLLYFLEKEVPYYIDALNPESTERFIELTHEKYKASVGKDFKSIVPGFYTDEPAMHYFQVGVDNFIVPWSKEMFKIFMHRRGYDLRPYLPALYMNMGEAVTAKVRYDFWRTLSEQYSESYYKRIRQWCDENQLIFTGHLLFEEWLRLQARCEGNIMHHLRHMHMTGVDHLYPKIGTEKEPDQHVALKLASSAAHHFGSTRLLCESMGGAYWDCTLERMKWIANWEYVLGVNLFNNHGYHYSIEGERKRDWPPSQFYHHTWWKYYDYFTSYMSRLGHCLSGGRHKAKLLMLYPLTSVWTNYTPQKRSDLARVIEDEFYFLTDALLRLHWDYDYVDEDVLASESKIKNAQIKISNEEYSVLIVPPVTHIKKKTWEMIRKFVSQGGHVIANSLLPVELLDDSHPEEIHLSLDSSVKGLKEKGLKENSGHRAEKKEDMLIASGNNGKNNVNKAANEVRDIFGSDPRELLEAVKTGSKDGIKTRKGKTSPNVLLLSSKGKTKKQRKQELSDALSKMASQDFTSESEQIFYLHRIKDSFDIYFVANTSKDDLGYVLLSFEQNEKQPELWDITTGEVKAIMNFDVNHARTNIRLPFAQSQSYIVVFKDRLAKEYISSTNLKVESFIGGVVKGYLETKDKEKDVIVKLKTEGGMVRRTVREQKKKELPAVKLGKQYEFSLESDNTLLLSDWRMKVLSEGENSDDDDEETLRNMGYEDNDYNNKGWIGVTNGAWEMMLPFERDKETYPVDLLYRTDFLMEYMPEEGELRLLIDGFSSSKFTIYVNASKLNLSQAKRSFLDAEIKEIDIKSCLKQGLNFIFVKMRVERRTEGILDLLKIMGCFSLQRDLEGKALGSQYKIVAPKEKMTTGDWTKMGYPYFSGTAVYKKSFRLKSEYFDDKTGTPKGKMILEADCREDVLEVIVNNLKPCVLAWHPYKLDITGMLRPGENTITLKVTNTLINLLEAVEKPSGLFSEPVIKYHHFYQIDTRGSDKKPEKPVLKKKKTSSSSSPEELEV